MYEKNENNDVLTSSEGEKIRQHRALRERFIKELKGEGLKVQEEVIGEHCFVKIHVPFARMCEEAEKVHIEMPLRNVSYDCTVYVNK